MSPADRGPGPEAKDAAAAAAAAGRVPAPDAAGAAAATPDAAREVQDAPAAGAAAHPCCTVAVVIEREAHPNRWEDWRFRIAEVLPDDGAFGSEPRLLRDDGRLARFLHPGLAVTLFRDEGEGYYLNLTSGAPVWFVTWRVSDEDPSRAWPEAVTLSYNEAARWLDAQERVDNLPLPPEMQAWLATFTDAHYRPEPKQRRRPPSFLPPEQRG
ncbi:MAG TPA: DUF3305 domain-containing protein [Phenylobacterium sp.]|nr:DUF3305 domain-containing protein [Phenylobacterium sp.]